MEIQKGELKLRISVPRDEVIRARDLADLVASSNSLYEILATALLWPDAFGERRLAPLPDAHALRVLSIEAGSDINLVYLGLDKALAELRRVLELIRDWKAKKAQSQIETEIKRQRQHQEVERSEQEHQKTIAMKLKNIKDAVRMVDELPVSREVKEGMYRVILEHAEQVERNPNTMFPR